MKAQLPLLHEAWQVQQLVVADPASAAGISDSRTAEVTSPG